MIIYYFTKCARNKLLVFYAEPTKATIEIGVDNGINNVAFDMVRTRVRALV